MKTKNILAAFTLLAASLCPTMAQAQSDEAKMNTFIDNLMNKMTLKEKLGQLNLPVTGDIVTGQGKKQRRGKQNQAWRSRRTLQPERC